jgi:D-hexose-6-phosphate mutarotase
MSHTPSGGEDLLWMSDFSYYEVGKPLRGGVPICWPWFGAGADESKPSHGLARICQWEIEDISECGGGTCVELVLRSSATTRKLWPHSFELRYRISSGAKLRLELETRNTGSCGFSITEALHTYFAVSDINAVAVGGFDGCRFLDTLDGKIQFQHGDIRFSAETDRVYYDSDDVSVIFDSGKGRKIINVREGSRASVVWNPWIAKARRLPDFGDNEYPGMVCVETANCKEVVVEIAPGEVHRMAAVIDAEKI